MYCKYHKVDAKFDEVLWFAKSWWGQKLFALLKAGSNNKHLHFTCGSLSQP